MARIDLPSADRARAAAVSVGDTVHRLESVSPDYEPPALEELGTFAELTRGTVPSGSDGVGPGSQIP